MEPVMELEVVVEEAHTSTLLADLSRRRANVLHLSQRHDMRVRACDKRYKRDMYQTLR